MISLAPLYLIEVRGMLGSNPLTQYEVTVQEVDNTVIVQEVVHHMYIRRKVKKKKKRLIVV